PSASQGRPHLCLLLAHRILRLARPPAGELRCLPMRNHPGSLLSNRHVAPGRLVAWSQRLGRPRQLPIQRTGGMARPLSLHRKSQHGSGGRPRPDASLPEVQVPVLDQGQASLELETSDGPFHIAVFDGSGKPLSGNVVAGQSGPPRGWLSRYYGEKVSVPSLSVEVSERLALTMVSILGAHVPSVSVTASTWSVTAGDRVVQFELNADGIIQPRSSTHAPVPA